MDRRHGSWLYPVLACWPRPSGLYDLEQTHVQRLLPQIRRQLAHRVFGEEEQDRFEAFLERLRDAKDKAEFDQFMEERARKSEERAAES